MQESMVNLESQVRTPLSLVHSLDKIFRYSMNVKYRDAMSPLSHCLVNYDLTPDFGAKKSQFCCCTAYWQADEYRNRLSKNLKINVFASKSGVRLLVIPQAKPYQ